MKWLERMAAGVAMVAMVATVAAATEWNDKTTLKFSEPVMIPGTTLAPGTYTFKLANSNTNRHLVQIFNENETRLIATAQAVPTKRMEPRGDVVIRLNPTETGTPAAVKAWFYPGSIYGHEFIYSDEQAREIAARTKTLVLSTDVAGSDMQRGALYTYDADGSKTPWRADDAVIREWEAWRQEGLRARATTAAPGTADTREATAPAVSADPKGTTVPLGDLEENATKYAGKTINVTAEVEEVFGPRLFKIDEPHWGDLDGEVLVYLPSNLAALVREDDTVTVTGTMKKLAGAEIERELDWLEGDVDLDVDFVERPVLVASRIVGGNSDVALVIDAFGTGAGETQPVGTGGTAGSPASHASNATLTSAEALASGDEKLIGRRVSLEGATVSRAADGRGFRIAAGESSVFVLPAAAARTQVREGQQVSIDGVVFDMPRRMQRGIANPDDEIYVYATSVEAGSVK